MLLGAVSGSFVLGSLITAVFVGFTVLEQREVDFCLNHANKNWTHDTRLTAVSVLQTAVRWHWAHKLSHTVNAASRTTMAQQKKKLTASAKVSSAPFCLTSLRTSPVVKEPLIVTQKDLPPNGTLWWVCGGGHLRPHQPAGLQTGHWEIPSRHWVRGGH